MFDPAIFDSNIFDTGEAVDVADAATLEDALVFGLSIIDSAAGGGVTVTDE